MNHPEFSHVGNLGFFISKMILYLHFFDLLKNRPKDSI